jgi:hypothetical protein
MFVVIVILVFVAAADTAHGAFPLATNVPWDGLAMETLFL